MTMKSDKPEPEERIEPYLWDGSGQPDPEVEKLEALLNPFRYDSSARAIPRVENSRARVRQVRLFPAFAYMAGVAAIAVVLVVMFVRVRQTTTVSGPGWVLSDVHGTLRLGKTTVSAGKLSSHLGVGQMLETGAQSQARLTAEQTGQIDVDPNTRLRLVAMGNETKRIALDHGVIHAFIWHRRGSSSSIRHRGPRSILDVHTHCR